MSGHSHWAKVKYKKAIADKRKGQGFSKLIKAITVAAKEGSDIESNFKLRLTVELAGKSGVPKENIERAIKRGSGEISGGEIYETLYEAYAPGGVALIIKILTDNKNRALSELKSLLSRSEGKIAEAGSVKYLFEEKGIINIDLSSINLGAEDLELKAIDQGAEDVEEEDGALAIYTAKGSFKNVEERLEKEEIKIENAEIGWIAKNKIELEGKEREKVEGLIEEILDLEDVEEVYSNLK